MLEDLAYRYSSLGEDELRGLGYFIIIIGGLVGGYVTHDNGTLKRAPYFAYSGAILFAVAVVQILWLGSVDAMKGHYLWVFMIANIAAGAVAGYFIAVVAKARSRDAFGHSGQAVLAFIPIANLVLLLKRSKNNTADPTIPILSGPLGVVTGFVFIFLAAGVATFVNVQVQQIVKATQGDPDLQAAGVDYLIRANGLEGVLQQAAANVTVPIVVDEVTTLTAVEVTGITLTYHYTLATPGINSLPEQFRTSLVQRTCQSLRQFIQAGATVGQGYYRPDGTEIATVAVTRDQCAR